MFLFHSECLVGDMYEKLYECGLEKGREEEYGLYLEVEEGNKKKKKKGIWLERNKILSSYSVIFSVDFIELKKRELKRKKSIKEFIHSGSPTSSPSLPHFSGEVLFEGKVLKFQQTTKQWKARHLRIFTDGLEYSKAQENGRKTSIPLRSIKNAEVVKKPKKSYLHVLTENQGTFKFEIGVTNVLEDWLRSFHPLDNHAQVTEHSDPNKGGGEEKEEKEEEEEEEEEKSPESKVETPVSNQEKPTSIPKRQTRTTETGIPENNQNSETKKGESATLEKETMGKSELQAKILTKEDSVISSEQSSLLKRETKKRMCCCIGV